MQLRDRIKELRRVPASQLRPNPKNWRSHPKQQQDALRGVLSEVGIANAVIARELEDGSLMLIDGHLRAETIESEMVPVLVLDVNEAEADKLLATLDPLAELAKMEEEKLAALLQSVSTDNEALAEMFSSMVDWEKVDGLDDALEENEEDAGDEPDEPPPSGVRMVQLFFNETTLPLFVERIDKLSKAYGVHNLTDTVFEAVYRESLKINEQSSEGS